MERKTLTLVAAAAALTALLSACDQRPSSTSTPDKTTPRSTAPKPDNTANNARDRDGTTTTPGDAGQSSSDVRIAADIRKAIMDESSLSTNAKNVKVIVKNGAVTLRGVVETQAE